MSTELVVKQNQSGMMTLKSVTDRVNMVHQVMEKVMLKGTHYGTVPGCGNKQVLFKPGADVLAMTFRLVPQFKVEKCDMENGHREYDVTCTMYGPDGTMLGQGVGSGSTMEKKYRYRKEGEKKIENEDIADTYNTVLKMAKKRAQIDATLTVTGAADMFTQDLIDNEDEPEKEPIREPQAKKTESAESKVVGTYKSVSQKPAGNGTKYAVQINENWYSTFSDTVAATLTALKGKEVIIVYATNDKGFHNIVTVSESNALPM